MMKHVIILVILLVISFQGLLRTPGEGGNLSLTLTPEIMSPALSVNRRLSRSCEANSKIFCAAGPNSESFFVCSYFIIAIGMIPDLNNSLRKDFL